MSEHNYSKLEDRQLDWWHMMANRLAVALLWFQLNCWKYRMKVKGKENKPKGLGSYIMASNHISDLDPPIISVIMGWQPVSYMAKRELFEHPAWALYYWWMATFAVNREKLEMSTVKSALKVLKSGRWVLGLFPEGTRNPDGSVQEAKRGVAFFAKSANVPVLPIGLCRKGKNRTQIRVRIGPLIPPEDDMDAMTEKVQNAIAELVKQAEADP